MTERAPKDRSEGDLNTSNRRKEWEKENLTPREKELIEEDASYFIHQGLSTPCLTALSDSDGIYIQDVSGKKYMDFHGNNVHNVGFKNSDIIKAIKEQLEDLPFCTRRYTNVPAIELTKKLAQVTPGDLNKTLLCPGGAEAVGIALKIARGYTGSHKTISFWNSFHGATLDTIGIGGEEIFRKDFGPFLPGTIHVRPPNCYRHPLGYDSPNDCMKEYAEMIEYVIETEGDIGAIIAEPIRSTSAMDLSVYWRKVRKICDEHEVLLIFDEIANGFGRTGKMFACQHFDITPDILVLGKPLGGGILPLAATITREELDIFPDRALGHYTHEKNPVLCKAGLKTLEIIEREKLMENAANVGRYTLPILREMMKDHELIGDVRGKGLLIAIELVKDRDTKERASDAAEEVMYKALEKGLSFKLTRGNIIILSPALTITKNQMNKGLDILEESIAEVEGNE